jgi:hypothetical protein
MPSNIDVKAKVTDMAALKAMAAEAADGPPVFLKQSDTFFCVPQVRVFTVPAVNQTTDTARVHDCTQRHSRSVCSSASLFSISPIHTTLLVSPCIHGRLWLLHSTRARHTCSFYASSFSLHHATCTHVHSLQGRLKLRVVNDLSELIFYDRPDRPGPKPSDFHTTHVSDPDTLRETLRELLVPCFRALVIAPCINVAWGLAPSQRKLHGVQAQSDTWVWVALWAAACDAAQSDPRGVYLGCPI